MFWIKPVIQGQKHEKVCPTAHVTLDTRLGTTHLVTRAISSCYGRMIGAQYGSNNNWPLNKQVELCTADRWILDSCDSG